MMKYAAFALIALVVIVVGVLLRKSGGKQAPEAKRSSFRMAIDDVFALKQSGSVVVVGKVAEGEVRPNDTLHVHTRSGSVQVQVVAIEAPAAGQQMARLDRAGAEDRIGLMLQGIDKQQIQPGDLLSDVGARPQPTAPVVGTGKPKYEAGQVWTYRTRPGETASRLTIGKVEPYGSGHAIHISVSNVSIPSAQSKDGKATHVSHLPFAPEAIDKSVVKLEASGVPLPEFEEGYWTWKEQADKGKAGVFTITVAEALDVIEGGLKNAGSSSRPTAQTQPSSVSPWRTHPALAGRFHPSYPDDVQVIVHDGGPRLTKHRPELVWVRVTGVSGDVFTGQVLNAPTQLTGVRQNQPIRFVMPKGAPHPILATDKYLAERDAWTIHPCDKCGNDQLFDAPSDLLRVIFPNLPPGSTMEMFTSFCPLCGGVQGIESKTASPADPPDGRRH